MARPLRTEQAGGWYHVTTRGNERRAIFRSDGYREHFLELLAEMTRRFGVRLHAYVLMDNLPELHRAGAGAGVAGAGERAAAGRRPEGSMGGALP